MRILMLHNRYMQPGGEDVAFESEVALLRENGCDVLTHEEDNARAGNLKSIRMAASSMWSKKSFENIRWLLAENRCDVMHVHNFFPQLSPSVYYAARAAAVPVVQTLHNYRLLCPSATFFRDGRVCEDCKGRFVPWPGAFHRCYRNSWAASGTVVAMLSVHKAARTWSNLVDVYIALTEFARNKFVEGGLPADKIMVKGNFVRPAPAKPGEGNGEFALFVGRLDEPKGVRTLLSAWERLIGHIPLKIIGDGPLASYASELARNNGNITILPWLPRKEVLKVLGEAKFLIFPSLWYEGQSLVLLEAFAMGTPAIASELGAMTEMIESGRTGFLFRAGDATDLAAKVERAWAHPEEARSMRSQVREQFEVKYTGAANYAHLIEIYEKAIRSASTTRTGLRP